MSFLLACIDHRLARLESAARTFLRSDLHRREARAAVERDAFDLNAFEEENEVHEPVHECGDGDDYWQGTPGDTHICRVCNVKWRVIGAGPLDIAWIKDVPADLAASGGSPAAESEPPSPAAGHSTLLLKAAAIICDLQQHGPVSDARFKASVNPIIGRLHDAAWQLADERAK